MRLALFVVVVVVALGLACARHHATSDLRFAGYPDGHRSPYRLVVVDFADATPGAGAHEHADGKVVSHEHGAIFAEAFAAALVELPGHVVTVRADAAQLIQQAAISQAVGARERDLALAVDVDGIVLGSVTSFDEEEHLGVAHGRVAAQTRLVDLLTGSVVWTVAAEVAAHGTVEQVAREAAERMVGQLRSRLAGSP